MTLNDQIELMENVRADGNILNGLKEGFATYASDCPISGTRETTIVEEFDAAVASLMALYKEVCQASAEWITEQ